MNTILSKPASEHLLQLAKHAVATAVSGDKKTKPPPSPPGCDAELSKKCGMFVTLKHKGELRGCLGIFESDAPVTEQVLETARDSAIHDSRFFNNPIRPDELDGIDVSISLLSELEPTGQPDKITIGVHGIVVSGKGSYSGKRGVFLPQVATEYNLDVPTFWNWVCSHKAGLPSDAWRHPDICQCEIFTAQIIGKD